MILEKIGKALSGTFIISYGEKDLIQFSVWMLVVALAAGLLLGWVIASGAIIPVLSIAIIAGVWWWRKQKGGEPMKQNIKYTSK